MTGSRRLAALAALAATAAFLLVPGIADARRPKLVWKQVGEASNAYTGHGANVVTGRGTIGWLDVARRNVIARTAAGASVTPIPPECMPPQLLGVGDGYALLQCQPLDERDSRYCSIQHLRIVALATGESHPLTVGAPIGCGETDPGWFGVGQDWIEGWSTGHEDSTHNFVNWRTGEEFNDGRDSFGADHYLDLSAPQLGRPLCAGVQRVAIPDDIVSEPNYETVEVAGRWVVQRLGGKAVVVRDCRQSGNARFLFPTWPQISGDLMVWFDSDHAPPYQKYIGVWLPRGPSFEIKAPKRAGVTMIGRSFYAIPNESGPHLRIYRATIPKRR